MADFITARGTATSAREAGLHIGSTASPDSSEGMQHGAAGHAATSARPYNPYSVSMRRMQAAGPVEQQQQPKAAAATATASAAAGYSPVLQKAITPLWATRAELQQQHRHGRQQHQQQHTGGNSGGNSGGGVAAADEASPLVHLDRLRPSLRVAVGSFESTNTANPASQTRRQSLCTATAQQLRM